MCAAHPVVYSCINSSRMGGGARETRWKVGQLCLFVLLVMPLLLLFCSELSMYK